MWNRKRTYNAWDGGYKNNFQQRLPNMSHFQNNNWKQHSWQSPSFNKRPRFDYQRRNQRTLPNRRISSQGNANFNRWEPPCSDIAYNRNMNRGNFNRIDYRRHSVGEQDFRRKEDWVKDPRPYLKWIKDFYRRDPASMLAKMKKDYWDQLDPKEDIRYLSTANKRLTEIPPYDGTTPRGQEGITKAWHCSFCNTVILDAESKKLHTMQKQHYIKYANLCKTYADEKIAKMELEKKMKKEKKAKKSKLIERDGSPKKLLEGIMKSAVVEKAKMSKIRLEKKQELQQNIVKKVESLEERTRTRSEKERKDKLKLNQLKEQDKNKKTLPKMDVETVSIDEELNYDFLE